MNHVQAGKKPYNPILAETHLAWVDSEKLEGGPFKGKTIFFAEQVTHHPPCTTYITINTEEKFKLETCVEFSKYISKIEHGRLGYHGYVSLCENLV